MGRERTEPSCARDVPALRRWISERCARLAATIEANANCVVTCGAWLAERQLRPAMTPPSTSWIAPVVQPARSESRNSM